MLRTLAHLTALIAAVTAHAQEVAVAPCAAHYTVRATDAAADVIPLDVALRVDGPPHGRLVVAIPVWTPGSYRLRPFPQRISAVRAEADGAAVPVTALDEKTWEIQHGTARQVTVHYRVELRENDRFMLRGDLRRCITYEGPAVYMYLRDHLRLPCHVHFDLPEGWAVASGLAPQPDGSHFAPDYDVLADCPVKLGLFQDFTFTVMGRRVDVVVDGPGPVEFDAAPWLDNIRRVVEVTGAMFGELPFDRYVFLYTASPGGEGGGLEHLTSTCIGVRANSLRRGATAGIGTTAHEFFHCFNVKRLRPRELGPFDYSRENRTEWLWLMEGVTSYYTEVLQARAGLETADAFWNAMASAIRTFEATPARHAVSSATASMRVWDDDPFDRRLNYYNSGTVLGLLLDLEIRAGSGGAASLDDWMRALYALCRDRGAGFDLGEPESLASTLARRDMRPFFDRHVRGTVMPDYARILGAAGFGASVQESESLAVDGVTALRGELFWSGGGAGPGRVDTRQGRITAIDGRPLADGDGADALVRGRSAGDRIELTVDALLGSRQVQATVVARPSRRVTVAPIDGADAGQLALRAAITAAPSR